MPIRVVNKYKEPHVAGISIMRPSPVGNPYTHLDYARAAYRVATREEAVAKFEKWLRTELALRTPEVRDVLNEIFIRAKRGEEVNLICCCAPKACHGDVIKRMVEAKLS